MAMVAELTKYTEAKKVYAEVVQEIEKLDAEILHSRQADVNVSSSPVDQSKPGYLYRAKSSTKTEALEKKKEQLIRDRQSAWDTMIAAKKLLG